MVFGTAAAQIEFDRTAHLWWAWFPVRLQDGRVAWLGSVCRWWAEDGADGWRYAAREKRARRAVAFAR
jgi:hypothetical protein